MSSYKSHRRPATTSPDPNAFQVDSKYRIGVDKLRELFPNWTDQDLQSVLAEVAGDVSIAATRITEGYAEQWGNVSRKKDKKTSAPQSNSGPTSNGNSQVGGVPRGGRGGGRGGRGGFSRGGRGGGPGAVGRVPSARDVNGSKQDADASKPTDSVTNGIQTSTTDSWVSDAGGWHSQEPAPDGSETVAQLEPVESTTLPEPTQSATKSSAWDTAVPNETPSQAKPTVATPLKSSKVPTGAKLSWAQIARAQEKPKPTPPAPPIAPAPVQPPTPVEVSSTAPEPQEQPAVPQWEEPTTAEAPTWDDEPPYVQPPQAEADSTTKKEEDGWIGSEDSFVVVSKPAVAEEEAPAPPSSTIVEPPASVASSLTTPSLTTATTPSASSPAPSTSPKPSTPRPTNTSRMAHRFKADQAVVMPSFGTIGGVTSLGMQFGSLGISGDDIEAYVHILLLYSSSRTCL
ncbi:hypothetical protein SISNIDRAFT_229935 [Sistotremastrum niveocremeum HHB9708]|uniref:RNA polymerase II degradation factor 1 n=1 Tax=Sistotremastrum niveocremeum HHB9708 TaxID=1314777 RepID=A0A164Q6R2_9AGAM|nr:hypothetical protein SISNIDRAFT_229935 [Sistotremastrum niveocremeum HHB9708]